MWLKAVTENEQDMVLRRLAAAEAELVAQFPGVAPEAIHALVETQHRSLVDVRIHDYLAVLVQRQVRDLLNGAPADSGEPD